MKKLFKLLSIVLILIEISSLYAKDSFDETNEEQLQIENNLRMLKKKNKNDNQDQEYVNFFDVAYQTMAQQSSQFMGYVASNAVSGHLSENLKENTCSKTLSEDNAWWATDLQAQRHIRTILIQNEQEGKRSKHGRKLKRSAKHYDQQEDSIDIIITVGNNSDISKNPSCFKGKKVNNQGSVYPCDLQGRYLGIIKQSYGSLTLCSVKAYEFSNIAAQGETTQSSVYKNMDSSNPLKWRSGNINEGSCSYTQSAPNNFWKISFQNEKYFAGAAILNSDTNQDALNGIQIYVGNDPVIQNNQQCNVTISNIGSYLEVDCLGQSGQYFGIFQSKATSLVICGIIIFGADPKQANQSMKINAQWELVASGFQVSENFSRGLSVETETIHSQTDYYRIATDFSISASFFFVSSSFSLSTERTKTIFNQVRKDIVQKTETGCSTSCGDGTNIFYLYQWKMSGTSQQSDFELYSCNFWCSKSEKPPKCPLFDCANRECSVCKSDKTKCVDYSTPSKKNKIIKWKFTIDDEDFDCDWFKEDPDTRCDEYGDYQGNDVKKRTASQACCVCGGGVQVNEKDLPKKAYQKL